MNLTEYEECVRLVNYLDVLQMQSKLRCFTHIPSETYTPYMNQRFRNKKLGVSSGFPDYLIVGRVKAITIEMKRVRGGSVTLQQKQWIADLNEVGIPSFICKGFDEARKVVEEQLL